MAELNSVHVLRVPVRGKCDKLGEYSCASAQLRIIAFGLPEEGSRM